MSAFLEVDHVDKVFPLRDGGSYIALKNIALTIKQGEFVSLIGHSGCGKSTLLNIMAGLDQATVGGVILDGRQVTTPGPDRMMVFQNYSLLPWLSVRQNIGLSVNKVLKHLPKGERRSIIEHNINLVGLSHAADKTPKELSGGMKQRVAIARALAIRPQVLLLDEPFGALDALTRGNLQQQLMQICQESKVTCVMVTHDVDEALLLSDRVVMLTNGPESHIGQILQVPIPRPRQRLEVVKHPSYYGLRNEIVYFLNQQKRDKKRKLKQTIAIARHGLEKVNLEIGFLPLIDAAPLIVAKEKGFFAKHGLEEVTLSKEPSWGAVAEGVSGGRLDAAQMTAGMPLSLTLGFGGQPQTPIVTALVMSRNGNAITFGKKLLAQGVRSLKDLKSLLEQNPEQKRTFGVVYPTSMHNLMLRYWLASAGIDPDHDVNLTIIPPTQMVQNLSDGNIDGYCAGEPWNSRAVQENLGYVIATDLDIWPSHPEKVLGVSEAWSNKYPETHNALVKALLEACDYCDERRHREEILELLSRPEYVGSVASTARAGFIDPYDRGMGEPPEDLWQYNRFHADKSNCPGRVEGLWVLTQLARWGMIPFPKNWIEILERVRRVDLYGRAARELGFPDTEPNRSAFKLFDGKVFDPDDPIGYLNSLTICRDLRIEEILINDVTSEPVLKAVA
jgi:nitrate/nitrite transport system ATP-binding protein